MASPREPAEWFESEFASQFGTIRNPPIGPVNQLSIFSPRLASFGKFPQLTTF